MLPGWERIAPEDSNHPDADLVLRHDEAAVIMVGYVHRDPTATLDWVVLTRREIVAQSQEILAFEETRRMMPGPEFNVVSTARYRIETVGGWMPVLASAVRGRSVVIELIAFGGAPPVNETLFEDLIAGLEVRGSGES